jgi:hypothetical protein
MQKRAPLASVLLAWLLTAGPAVSQQVGSVPLNDLLEVTFLGRDVVALDGAGGQVTVRLNLSESVLWSGSRGTVGVVLTDERLLAVATGSAAWQEERYLRNEVRPVTALLGDRVALITTSQRVLGFSGTTRNVVEYRLTPRQVVRSVHVGENVGVVVTDRSALGLSPQTGDFSETKLQLHEQLESIDTRSTLATVRTNRRLLVFRAPSGTWSERRRELNEG